jgi:hypothetical protein
LETIAQLLLLLIALALFKAYVDGGMPRVRQWWRSKLIGGT